MNYVLMFSPNISPLSGRKTITKKNQVIFPKLVLSLCLKDTTKYIEF